MSRHYPVIMICCCHHGGWVSCFWFQCMIRRICVQIFKHFFTIVRRTVIECPASTGRKFMVTEHIQHTNCRESYFEELRTLCHTRSNQETTVGTTCNSQFFRRCVLLVNQIFCCCDKVVKYVLLVRLCTCKDRKSTRLNSSHVKISYAVFCLK